MNYGEILLLAEENKQNALKKDVQAYGTNYGPCKKVEKPRVLSMNVQKFLARKAEEEHSQKDEAQRKKEHLALRNLNIKSKKKLRKSCKNLVYNSPAEAINEFKQCDEDDYGYVSQEATDLYFKLLDNYKDMGEKCKPTKKESLGVAQGKYGGMMPHEEQNLGASSAIKNEKTKQTIDQQAEHKQKTGKTSIKLNSKNKGAPPMSYQELLKSAEEKQFQPIFIHKPQRKAEPERPMSSEEKEAFEEEEKSKLRKEKYSGGRIRRAEIRRKEKPRNTEEKKLKVTSQGSVGCLERTIHRQFCQ